MQKMVRLDKEFEALEQGGMSHADFRALFESKLQDMQESSMDMPTTATLYRRYLIKLNPELRTKVLSKEWKIDGEENPPRMPCTYRDVARAVGLLLEEMADIHATGHARCDQLMALDGSARNAPRVSSGGGGGSRGADAWGKKVEGFVRNSTSQH